MLTLTFDICAIKWDCIFNPFVRNLALDVVEQFMLDKEDGVGIAYSTVSETMISNGPPVNAR